MYYLLENGKIIDSKISYTANFPYWEIKDNCLFAKSKNDKLVRPCNENKIKKQSENVYDLIEVGDLVKYLNDIYEIKNVYYIDDGVVNFVTSNCGICFPSWEKFLKGLNAIYKLDAQGNYIKVWEKKENE